MRRIFLGLLLALILDAAFAGIALMVAYGNGVTL